MSGPWQGRDIWKKRSIFVTLQEKEMDIILVGNSLALHCALGCVGSWPPAGSCNCSSGVSLIPEQGGEMWVAEKRRKSWKENGYSLEGCRSENALLLGFLSRPGFSITVIIYCYYER